MPASTYPITTAVGIISKKNDAMVILTDRAQGATAKPKSGRVEVFFTRKTKGADMGGMGGSVNKFHELALDFKLFLSKNLTME